jgi:signal transduction histidine kinase
MVSLGIKDTNAFMTTYFPSFLLVLVLASAVGAWVYMQEEHLESQRRQFDKTVNYSSAQISDMQERARAFTEMANALSSTLNFEKILDAALNIGYLSLKKNLEDRHQRKPRMVSMVLLFENQGNVLSVFTSRGMKSVDDHRVIHGQEGIVAQALTEAIPMLGKNAAKDSELSTFASFAGILSTLVVPLRSGFDNFGVLVYGCDLPNAFGSDNIETLQALGTQATIALRNAVLYSNLMQEREKIVEMEENARKALVRDLHDLPAQTIAAIMMRIQIISKLLQKDPSSVPAELKIVEDMAKRVNDEIRHVLFSLRPLALESQGLTTALNQLADKMQNTFNQPVRIRIGHDIEQITSSHQQGIIFYLIEEAVNNARKYAKASLIRVSVERQGEMLVIQINDNGIGFDTGAVNEKYAQGKSASFGMVNMRERAALLDGTIQIESARGRGTTITVVIPVKPREDKPITQRNREAIPSTKLAQAAMDNFNNSLRSPRR